MVLAQEKYCLDDHIVSEISEPIEPCSSPQPRVRNRRVRKLKFGAKAFLATVLIGLFFLSGFALTLYFIYPSRLGYQVVKLEKEIEILERQQKLLELEVARAQAPERIASIATTQLAMMPMQESEILVSQKGTPPNTRGDGESQVGNKGTNSKAAQVRGTGVGTNETQIVISPEANTRTGQEENKIIRATAQVISGEIMTASRESRAGVKNGD